MFNKGVGGGWTARICSTCRLLWCKYSYCQCQATNRASLSVELGQDVGSRTSRLQLTLSTATADWPPAGPMHVVGGGGLWVQEGLWVQAGAMGTGRGPWVQVGVGRGSTRGMWVQGGRGYGGAIGTGGGHGCRQGAMGAGRGLWVQVGGGYGFRGGCGCTEPSNTLSSSHTPASQGPAPPGCGCIPG